MAWRSSLSASNDLSGIFSLSLESELINQYACDVSVQRSGAADVSFSAAAAASSSTAENFPCKLWRMHVLTSWPYTVQKTKGRLGDLRRHTTH